MKKTNKKLQLNKETIASLSKSEQGMIIGGNDFLSIFDCKPESHYQCDPTGSKESYCVCPPIPTTFFATC